MRNEYNQLLTSLRLLLEFRGENVHIDTAISSLEYRLQTLIDMYDDNKMEAIQFEVSSQE